MGLLTIPTSIKIIHLLHKVCFLKFDIAAIPKNTIVHAFYYNYTSVPKKFCLKL